MAKTLFVKANDRGFDASTTVKMYQTFVDNYQEANPGDECIEVDLFAENLPYLNADAINGMFKLGKGMDLTDAEQQAANNINRFLDQFLEADKVVVAFPLWNFAAPAVLHTYLDYLAQAGKTFRYTPEGPVGLITDKKVALLNARGGVYSEGPAAALEHSLSYVNAMFQFFGVQDIKTVVIEGHNQFPDRTEQIIEDGLSRVAEAAKSF